MVRRRPSVIIGGIGVLIVLGLRMMLFAELRKVDASPTSFPPLIPDSAGGAVCCEPVSAYDSLIYREIQEKSSTLG